MRSNDFENEVMEMNTKEAIEKRPNIVRLNGRIKKIRDFGRIKFIDFFDEKGSIQLKINSEKKEEKGENINVGDILTIIGSFCETTSNIPTIEVKKFEILRKCLKYLGSDYYGLKNVEERFRRRYLDFINNPEKKEIIRKRSEIIREIRNYLEKKDYIEIETPILVSESSGAQARPFLTYHNKLNKNFFLRIATEIPLKKMLVSGFEKIYEIGRIFRNEGIDARHNPEFTTIEIYRAYRDMNYMMKLTEKLFNYLSKEIIKKDEFQFNGKKIKIEKEFERISMREAIKRETGIEFKKNESIEIYIDKAKKFEVELEEFQKKSKGCIINAFFEKFVEKKINNPTFIYEHPIELSPLSKKKDNDPDFAERFELYIGGIEMANGYSELNDSEEQKKRFEEQIKQKKMGNDEAMDIDNDFIEALEYGMPPAGGLGIGIDRLIMLLTESESIKEVMAFPQMKNKGDKIDE